MPPTSTLTALQRRAQQGPTLTRTAANAQRKANDAPFVHAGRERYLTLAAAVQFLGVDDALTLAEDKRSMLLWPGYNLAVLGTLILSIFVGTNSMTEEENQAIRALPTIRDYHQLRVGKHASPLFRQIQEIAADLHRLLTRAQDGESVLSVWRLDPAYLRRLLTLTSASQAALLLMQQDAETLTSEQVRRAVSEFIVNPDAHTRTAMERLGGAPVAEAFRQAGWDDQASSSPA